MMAYSQPLEPHAQPASPSSVRLVLIGSAGHSGSTLLDLLLGSHSAISGAGEMNRLSLYPAERMCSCGQAVVACDYWNRVRRQVAARLGRACIRWGECHTDVPPLDPLVEIDEGPDATLQADGAPPETVRRALAARGIVLSTQARLTYGGLRDVKWRLLDEASGVGFVLRREEGRIRVYQPLVEWKNPLRRIPSPLEAAVALGSPRGVRLVGHLSRQAARHLETARNSWLVAEAMAAEDGTTFVVDSSKSAVRLKLLSLLEPLRVRVLHLVRDGRAVAASAMRRTGVSAAVAARLWKRENQHLALVLRGIPAAQKLAVRYEDLCADPSRELERICAFLGLRFEPSMTRLWERAVHNIPGNPMLFRKDRRTISTDDRWRRELSVSDLAAVESIIGRMNRRFGYSRS